MGNIQIFNHPGFGDIRISDTETDNPLFCAMDLCRALGYSNGRDAVAKHVDEDDVAKRDTTDSIGRVQQLTYVNESGMYALVLGSKLKTARKFKHWVTSEVLPSIRKHGAFSVEQLSRKQLALMVVQAEEEKERLALENKQQAEQLEEQKPKVTFANAIIGSNTYIIIRDLAKLIQQNGYEIGEKRLYQWLRDNHYLTLDNKPMQRYVEQGLFFISEGTHSENGVMKAHMTTKITPKGQQYFINKFIHQ
jgi:anti-repressor protein